MPGRIGDIKSPETQSTKEDEEEEDNVKQIVSKLSTESDLASEFSIIEQTITRNAGSLAIDVNEINLNVKIVSSSLKDGHTYYRIKG